MKVFKVLLETILPITIVTLIPIGHFFINDKLFPEPKLKNCDSCHISNITYLTYTLVIVILTSFYQLIFGKWILQNNKPCIILNIVNCMAFAIFYTGILAFINLFQVERKIEWDFIVAGFVLLFLFGLAFTVSIILFQKIFKQ